MTSPLQSESNILLLIAGFHYFDTPIPFLADLNFIANVACSFKLCSSTFIVIFQNFHAIDQFSTAKIDSLNLRLAKQCHEMETSFSFLLLIVSQPLPE